MIQGGNSARDWTIRHLAVWSCNLTGAGNGTELKEKNDFARTRSHRRSKSSAIGMVYDWIKQPEEVVEAGSVYSFKGKLDSI